MLKTDIEEFMDNHQQLLLRYRFLPENIWNFDETMIGKAKSHQKVAKIKTIQYLAKPTRKWLNT